MAEKEAKAETVAAEVKPEEATATDARDSPAEETQAAKVRGLRGKPIWVQTVTSRSVLV